MYDPTDDPTLVRPATVRLARRLLTILFVAALLGILCHGGYLTFR